MKIRCESLGVKPPEWCLWFDSDDDNISFSVAGLTTKHLKEMVKEIKRELSEGKDK